MDYFGKNTLKKESETDVFKTIVDIVKRDVVDPQQQEPRGFKPVSENEKNKSIQNAYREMVKQYDNV